MNDTQIIELYFQRRESAIECTAEKYGDYLNHIAFNILRCPEDSEEVVEDTYLAAWNTIPPTVPAVLKHFLSRIVRNLAFSRLDYLKAKRRSSHLDVLLSELEECLPDRRGSAEDMLEAKELGKCLNSFLEGLDRDDCRIFLSRYYYGLTISEIAVKFDFPQRRVKYRLSRLRGDLRNHLNKEGFYV